MASGPQVTLALGVGYLLGRRRRRKMLIMLGTAALAGGSGGPAGQLLRQGAKLAGSSLGSAETLGKVSPGAGEIAGLIRGELVQAGKAAAMAAVNSRIDSLSDQLHSRAETLRNPVAEAAATGGSLGETGNDDPGRDQDQSRDQDRGSDQQRNGGQGRASERDGRRRANSASQARAPRRTTGDGKRTASEAGTPARAQRHAPRETASGPPVRRAARPASQGR